MIMKLAAILLFPLLMAACKDRNPTGPVVASDGKQYGDTLFAGLRYQMVPDTAAAGGSAVEISLILRNLAGHSLTLDSTSKNMFIQVTQDSTNLPVFGWPDVLPSVDTLVRKVTLSKGDSLFFRGKWQRLDPYRRPLPLGRYTFDGYIYGFNTGRVYFQSL